MTTNNPPIAAWAPSTALAKLASRHNNAPCVLTDGPAEFNDVALVRLSDYERLQADLADMERDYLTIIEAQDAEHRKQLARLQAECEKLRRDAERYRWIKECDPEEIDIVIENPGDALDAAIDTAMETTQ